MRPPDLINEAGTIRAWRFVDENGVGPDDWKGGIASWFIEADEGALDPFGFRAWVAGGVHLRDIPGVPPAKRQYPEAAYEINVFTVDPTAGVTAEGYERRVAGDLDALPGGFLLTPADIVYQWHGTTDEQANEILSSFARAVVLGGLSPSRPVDFTRAVFDLEWRRRLDATVEHWATGHWPARGGSA